MPVEIKATFTDLNSVEIDANGQYFNNFTYEKIRPQIVLALEAAHAILQESDQGEVIVITIEKGQVPPLQLRAGG